MEDSQGSDSEVQINEGSTHIPQSIIDHKTTGEFPHYCLGTVSVLHPIHKQYSHSGTGFLISPTIVLTCAHVIFNPQTKDFFKRITFSPAPFGAITQRIPAVDYYVPKQYKLLSMSQTKSKKGVKYDYALLRLVTNVSTKNQKYLKLMVQFNNDSEPSSLYGYPSLSRQNNVQMAKQTGHTGEEEISIIKVDTILKRLRHVLPTRSGHSGSPLLTNKHYVIGLHKSAVQSRSSPISSNIAVLVHTQMVENLRKWETLTHEKINYKYTPFQVKHYLKQKSLSQSETLISRSPLRNQLSLKRIDPSNFTSMPTCCIGMLVTKYEGKFYKGTNSGFLISNNLVLTSLTSIYCPQFQNFRPDNPNITIHFHPCKQGKKGKSYSVQSFCFHQELIDLKIKAYKEGHKISNLLEDIQHDYCLLKLKEEVQNTHYLQLLANFSDSKAKFQFIGCHKGSDIDQQKQVISVEGIQAKSVLDIYQDSKLIYYQIATKIGMTGSPIIVNNSQVIGIHKFAHLKNNNYKGARLITLDSVDKLYEWNNILKGNLFNAAYYNKSSIVKAVTMRDLDSEHEKFKVGIMKSRIK